MLGGGHGFLQGQYGLMADQVISARLVLANGTAVTVSARSNPDLYWALKGAGHNFGIVTEVTYKVYDVRGHEDWSTGTFVFSGDQLEEFLTTINNMAQTQPAEAVHLGLMVQEPAFDTINVSPLKLGLWVADTDCSGCDNLDSVLRRLGIRLESPHRSSTRVTTTFRQDCKDTVLGHACVVPHQPRGASLSAWLHAHPFPYPSEKLRHPQHAPDLQHFQPEDARAVRLQYFVVCAGELLRARRPRSASGEHVLPISRGRHLHLSVCCLCS